MKGRPNSQMVERVTLELATELLSRPAKRGACERIAREWCEANIGPGAASKILEDGSCQWHSWVCVAVDEHLSGRMVA